MNGFCGSTGGRQSLMTDKALNPPNRITTL